MADRNDTLGGSSSSRTDESAKDKLKEKAHDAQEKVSEVAAKAKHKTEDLAEDGMEKAEELAHRAGDMARSRAEEEKDKVASGIRTVADALRRGGENLPEDRQSYGRFVESVADRAENLSRYLEERDVNDMARQARRFAREHTGAMISGAFALGMLGARFLKSSTDEITPDRWDSARRPIGSRYEGGYQMSGGYEQSRGYERGYGAAEYDRTGYDRPGGYSRGELHTGGRGATEPRYELDSDRGMDADDTDLAGPQDTGSIGRSEGLSGTDGLGRSSGGAGSTGRTGGV